jgi:hypothetical protein
MDESLGGVVDVADKAKVSIRVHFGRAKNRIELGSKPTSPRFEFKDGSELNRGVANQRSARACAFEETSGMDISFESKQVLAIHESREFSVGFDAEVELGFRRVIEDELNAIVSGFEEDE